MTTSPSLSLLLAALCGALVMYLLLAMYPSPINRINERPPSQTGYRMKGKEPAFYLGVSITFPNDEIKRIFIRDWTILANHIRKNELGTLTYELLYSDRDPLRILISERYITKDYYLQVHKASVPFLTFRKELEGLITTQGVKIDGHSYLESGIGLP